MDINVMSMCPMCGQNKSIKGRNEAGECSECQLRIDARTRYYLNQRDTSLAGRLASLKRVTEAAQLIMARWYPTDSQDERTQDATISELMRLDRAYRSHVLNALTHGEHP